MKNTEKTRFAIDETAVTRLVRQAKGAKTEAGREQAINNLWALCGEYVTNMAASKSYKIDSDFSLHGMSLKERQVELSSKTFRKFRDCVLKFDPSLGVPFLAWVAKKIGWQLLDDKRTNTKRSARETTFSHTKKAKGPDCSKELDSAKAYCCHGEGLLTGEASHFAQICDYKRLIAKCRKVIMERAPKLLTAFDAMEKDSKVNSRCCDSHFAKTLGYSTVYAGTLKKEIRDILVNCGMEWAPDSVATTVGVPQNHECAPTDEPSVFSLPGCSPYLYKGKEKAE